MHIMVVNYENLDIEAVQKRVLNEALEWFRIAPTSWIIDSGEEKKSQFWIDRMNVLLPETAKVIVVAINPEDHQGLMVSKFWTWFNARREKT